MKTARSFIEILLAAMCLSAFSCGDEADTPRSGCAQSKLDVCDEARVECDLEAETADNPRTAREQCSADWCVCVEEAGCELEDYRECTEP